MSKPSKWFKKLLRRRRRKSVSPNKPSSPSPATGNGNASNVTGIAIASSYGETDLHVGDPNKHAIAVAAATAAVAEAALAAARAAAEVVRLTRGNNNVKSVSGHVSRRWSYDELAAVVKIQSVFRGYLARKALKALRGLVKLQALVRGHFVRKQSADMLRRLQAMVRVQARARSSRVINIESSICSTGKETPRSNELCYSISSEKLEESPVLKRCGSNTSVGDSKTSEKTISATNWLDNWVEVGSSINNSNLTKTPNTDDEKNDKILEVDSWKPNSVPKSRNPNNHISTKDYYNHSFGASDYIAKYSPNRLHKPNVSASAEDNASLRSGASRTGSMRRSPKTPSREECSRSYLNGYATFASPSYMANTQSSRARARSLSVPRQRQEDSEKLSSVKRSLQAFWESKTSSKKSLESYSNLSQQRW